VACPVEMLVPIRRSNDLMVLYDGDLKMAVVETYIPRLNELYVGGKVVYLFIVRSYDPYKNWILNLSSR